MCRRTTCKTCKKPSWAGCGAHVESVLGDVPRSERCKCHEKPKVAARGKVAAPPVDESTLGRFKTWLRQ